MPFASAAARLAYQRRYQAARREKRRKAGVCQWGLCGAKADGWYCAFHASVARAYAQWYQRARRNAVVPATRG
jgi:hypothetical protein